MSQNETYRSGPTVSAANLVAVVLYLVLIAGVVAALVRARRWALTRLATPAARQQWQQWRSEAARQSRGTGPVQRKEVKIAEPPTVRMLRDRFAVCLIAAIVLLSILYWTLVLMLRGSLTSRVPYPLPEPEGPGPDANGGDSARH